MILRPDWRGSGDQGFGPLCLKMPVDPDPAPGVDWAAVVGRVFHEDSKDGLNLDGTWGIGADGREGEVGEEGGSGIAAGYACDDLEAVIRAADAVLHRKKRYNLEHWLRQIRFAIAAYEMTGDVKYLQQIIFYDDLARAELTDDRSTIHLGDPSWVPSTLAQFNALSKERPGQGLDYPFNGRAVGEVAYGHAMRLKVDPGCDRAWAHMLLRTCERAAIPHTGQVCADTNGHDRPTVYLFHQGLLVHGVLALYYQLGLRPPTWIYDWMFSVEHLPRMDQYGFLSPLKFCYTNEQGVLTPEESEVQRGDPGFAYHSWNCVALAKILPDARAHWLRRAARIGPKTANSQDEKKLSMLLRGALS